MPRVTSYEGMTRDQLIRMIEEILRSPIIVEHVHGDVQDLQRQNPASFKAFEVIHYPEGFSVRREISHLADVCRGRCDHTRYIAIKRGNYVVHVPKG